MSSSSPGGGVSGVAGATVSWRALLGETTQRLRAVDVESPDAEARWMVEEASGLSGARWITDLDRPASVRAVGHLDSMVDRRLAGEPLQYVLGRWGFRTLDLLVDRRVLIPRPETEQVVDAALSELDRLAPAVGPARSARSGFRAGETSGETSVESTSNRRRGAIVVDLGCGSGAIGLSIATERDDTTVWCVDASPGAAAVTRANLAGIGTLGTEVTVLEGSWFEPLPTELQGTVDLIVTNPPYVADDDHLPREVADWEPVQALLAGPAGLDAIEQILRIAPAWLRPGGAVVCEIGDTHARAVQRLAEQAGFVEVEVRPDLARRDRILIARRP